MDADAALLTALTAELAGKSDLVWLDLGGVPPRAVWHVWHDDAVALVTGGSEQDDPGLADADEVDLLLRSKENGSRQLRLSAAVEHLDPADEAWESAAAALHPKRLNAGDGEAQVERWRRESDLWLLRPTGRAGEAPGSMSDDSHRAVPPPTDATTVARTPFHAGRATRRRRRR